MSLAWTQTRTAQSGEERTVLRVKLKCFDTLSACLSFEHVDKISIGFIGDNISWFSGELDTVVELVNCKSDFKTLPRGSKTH